MNRPKTKTLDLKPNHGEMIKPSELIDISGAAGLTLHDRRLYNILIRHAFGPDLGREGTHFEVPVSDLRDTHDSNDRLEQSIESLMRTIVTIAKPDGSTTRVQLLGENNLADPKRKRGTLRYEIAPALSLMLKDSTVFAKLEIEVLKAFTSKYALALYEAVARRVRLDHVFMERMSLEAFRDVLGVPDGKLKTFGNLNQYAIKPALLEVNALADFEVSIVPEKQGRRVSGIVMGWGQKDIEGRKAAYRELQRPSVGRMARITGTAESVTDVLE